jgi:glycosyltransferase involved in cell wall biosynthesis
MIDVAVSGRALFRNVGGNSTYVRALRHHLPDFGVRYQPVAWGVHRSNPALDAINEGLLVPAAARRSSARAVHYPTDTGGLAVSRRVSPPAVATVHGVASAHNAGVRSPHAESLWRKRVGWTLACAERIITVSDSSAADLTAVFGVPPASIEVVPHGIDLDRFTPAGPEAVRPSGRRYVLYLGNLDPRKNVAALLAAADDEFCEQHDIDLVIAGRHAWGCEDVIAEALKRRHAHYLGPVPDESVAPLMRGAAVFVFPSLYEGFGFPVLEAMACGAPVVTTRRGALREVAGDAVHEVVDPSPRGVRAALFTALREDEAARRDRIASGLRHVSTFTWRRSAERHAEIFEAVARC